MAEPTPEEILKYYGVDVRILSKESTIKYEIDSDGTLRAHLKLQDLIAAYNCLGKNKPEAIERRTKDSVCCFVYAPLPAPPPKVVLEEDAERWRKRALAAEKERDSALEKLRWVREENTSACCYIITCFDQDESELRMLRSMQRINVIVGTDENND